MTFQGLLGIAAFIVFSVAGVILFLGVFFENWKFDTIRQRVIVTVGLLSLFVFIGLIALPGPLI